MGLPMMQTQKKFTSPEKIGPSYTRFSSTDSLRDNVDHGTTFFIVEQSFQVGYKSIPAGGKPVCFSLPLRRMCIFIFAAEKTYIETIKPHWFTPFYFHSVFSDQQFHRIG